MNMASPGQLQDKKLRLARTRARTTLSDIKRCRGAWEQAVKEGRQHLEEACNAITRLWMWPRLCSDTLIRCRMLLPVGMKSLRRRYVTEIEALRACQSRLEEQLRLMKLSLEALQQAIAPVENKALFTCFAARDFYKLLSDAVCPYDAQLQVWTGLFVHACSDTTQTYSEFSLRLGKPVLLQGYAHNGFCCRCALGL
jgi:hypothetical protein